MFMLPAEVHSGTSFVYLSRNRANIEISAKTGIIVGSSSLVNEVCLDAPLKFRAM